MVPPFLLISEVTYQCMNLIRDISQTNTLISPRIPLGWSRLDLKNMQIRESTRLGPDMFLMSSSSEEDQSSVPRQRSSKPSRAPSDQGQPQNDPDPLFYREVAMADLPSHYAEEVETFRRILDLPDPKETMPRSSISLLRDLGTINGTGFF